MEASTTGCSRTTRPPGNGPESAADSGAVGGGGAGVAGGSGAAVGGAFPAGVVGAVVGLCAGAAAEEAGTGAVAAILQQRKGWGGGSRRQ